MRRALLTWNIRGRGDARFCLLPLALVSEIGTHISPRSVDDNGSIVWRVRRLDGIGYPEVEVVWHFTWMADVRDPTKSPCAEFLADMRRIFAIEGIITMVLSLIAFVTLTDRPETARWMSEEEKELAINRVKSERLAQPVLLDKVDAKKLKRGFSNPITLATASVFLLDNITVLGISFFLPTIIKAIYPGRTTVQQQLLTVPPYIVGAGCTVILTTLSWRLNTRQVLIVLTGPLVVIGYAIFLGTMNPNVRYAAVFLSASTAFSLGAMTNAQVSANANSDSARNIAIGTNGKSCLPTYSIHEY